MQRDLRKYMWLTFRNCIQSTLTTLYHSVKLMQCIHELDVMNQETRENFYGLRYRSGIHMKELRKTTRGVSQNSPSSDRFQAARNVGHPHFSLSADPVINILWQSPRLETTTQLHVTHTGFKINTDNWTWWGGNAMPDAVLSYMWELSEDSNL